MVLTALAFGVFAWLERLERSTRRTTHVVMPPTDYQFKQVEYAALDRKGQLRIALASDVVSHARDEKILTVNAPHIMRLANGDASYELRSNVAQIFDQGKRVELQGDVTVTSQNAIAKNNALAFQTQSLTLHPEQRLAETAEHVEVQQNGATLAGDGLLANFQTEMMEIKANAQARIPRRKN